MTEEYLQEILNPVFRNLALGEDNEFKLVTEEAAYAALLAVLSVGVMEGPNIVSSDKAGHGVDANTQTAQSVLDGGFAVREDGGVRFDTQTGVDTPATQTAVEGLETLSTEVAPETQKTATDGVAVNEAGLVSLSKRERENLSSGGRNKIVDTVKETVDFVRNALINRKTVDRAYMGKIPDSVVEFVYKQTGIDISGFSAMMNGDDVRHIIKKHGDPLMEAAKNQIHVTPEDIAMIPQILAAPDSVDLSPNKDHKGRTVLIFTKNIDGKYVTIQAVSDGKKLLQTDTMYIIKNEGSQDTGHNAANGDPVNNAQSVPPQSPSEVSIPQTAPDVNTETGKDMAAPASQPVDPLIADIRSRSAGQTASQPVDPLIADIRSRGATGKPGTQTAVEGMETAATEMAQVAQGQRDRVKVLYSDDSGEKHIQESISVSRQESETSEKSIVRLEKTINVDSDIVKGVIPEGAEIENIRIIAGGSSKTPIRVVKYLSDTFGGDPLQWIKMGGIIKTDNFLYDVHWFELDGKHYKEKLKGVKRA